MRQLTAAAVVALAMCACTLQAPYRTPQVAVSAWHAPQPHEGSVEALVDWWQRFDDPVVGELVRMAESGNPSVARAAAAIDSARATLVSKGADGYPSVTFSGSIKRGNQSEVNSSVVTGGAGSSVGTTRSGEFDASWELDLFGKVRSSRKAAQAQLQASIADWHDARVSIAAEVADDYVQYRACRLLFMAYSEQASSQSRTAQSTRAAVAAGLSAPADRDLAEASAASAFATATQQDVACQEVVKSLVVLTGADETELQALINRSSKGLPEPAAFRVDSVPADLVRQRPDLASAERGLAADYAAIGEAVADQYPSLTLNGTLSISAPAALSPTRTWDFGPSLSVPLFDAGKKRAAVKSARATYDQQLATYRNAVRKAVSEVETALVDLDGAARRADDARLAADRYRSYVAAIDSGWHAGFQSLLDLEEARRSAISAQVTLIGLQRDRVRYWIALYKALGGGWQADQTAATRNKSQSGSAAPSEGTP